MTAKDVKAVSEKATEELKATDRSDPGELETFLKDISYKLPDTHQLVREVQYGIINILKSHLVHMLDNAQLLRKAYLCKWSTSICTL